MKFTTYLLNKIARHFGVADESLKYWNAFNFLTQFKAGIPRVLINAGVEHFSRGFLNQVCISTHLDWLWPYWVNQQFYPKSPDFVARGLQLYTTNVTHRNWTAIGWPEGVTEPIVDPRGLVTPFLNSWSLDFLIFYEGELISPARLVNVRQSVENNLPIVVTEFKHQDLSVKAEVFVAFVEKIKKEIIFEKVILKNNSSKRKEATFIFSLRPYNPEGISLVNSLEYSAFGDFLVNGKVAVIFQESPGTVFCSNLEKGDAVLKFKNIERRANIYCPAGLATGILVYQLSLDPGQEEFFEARLPVEPFKEEIKKITAVQALDFEQVKKETIDFWQEKLKNAVKISLPDKNLENFFKTNLAYLRLFFDRDQITPGPFTYHYFWLRDATYMTFGLEIVGLQEEARKIIESLLKKQKSDGAFLHQEGEWDSVGQVAWIALKHCYFTNDLEYLKTIYPSILKAAKWIEFHRNIKISQNDILFGLLPPGLSAEHFGFFDYYYWDNYWAIAAVRELIQASKILGLDTDQKFLEKLCWEFTADIVSSLEKASGKIGRPILPISPHRGMDSAAIGSLASVYPLRIFSAFDERVTNTIKFLDEKCTLENGFFHDVNHSGFGTYLTMHLAEVYLFERNPKFWQVLEWLINLASSTYCWPEAVHPVTRGGCMGDGHHGWAVAEFLILMRHLLFFEEYDRLIVTPCLKPEWLEQEGEIKIENAPSYFGKINIRIKVYPKKLIYEFDAQYHQAPREIEINLPVDIERCRVDGREHWAGARQIFCGPLDKIVEVDLK